MAIVSLGRRGLSPAPAQELSPGSAGPVPAPVRFGVPWSTVLPIAVVFAYADGYWLTSLRGAIGAIERTDSPFRNWEFESTLSIPLFVGAVISALTLAHRWFGPVLRSAWSTVITGVVVVLAGTGVGLAEVAASAAYDYHLQGSQVQFMDNMAGGHCSAACVASTNSAQLTVELRGLWVGGKLLIITNLVVVAWLVAMRGGRLYVTRTARSAARPGRFTAPSTQAELVRLLLVAALLGAAVVHAVVAIAQLTSWPLAGLLFLVLSGAEGVLAVRLALEAGRATVRLAAALAAATVLAWLYTRVFGMPLAPVSGVPGHLMLPGWAVCVLDGVVLLGALTLLRQGRRRASTRLASTHPAWLGALLVLAVTIFGLAATGPL
jgi:hypothetical protein